MRCTADRYLLVIAMSLLYRYLLLLRDHHHDDGGTFTAADLEPLARVVRSAILRVAINAPEVYTSFKFHQYVMGIAGVWIFNFDARGRWTAHLVEFEELHGGIAFQSTAPCEAKNKIPKVVLVVCIVLSTHLFTRNCWTTLQIMCLCNRRSWPGHTPIGASLPTIGTRHNAIRQLRA